jgi:hypothetical protein
VGSATSKRMKSCLLWLYRVYLAFVKSISLYWHRQIAKFAGISVCFCDGALSMLFISR